MGSTGRSYYSVQYLRKYACVPTTSHKANTCFSQLSSLFHWSSVPPFSITSSISVSFLFICCLVFLRQYTYIGLKYPTCVFKFSLVTPLIAMTKYLEVSNLRIEGLITALLFKEMYSTLVEKMKMQRVEASVVRKIPLKEQEEGWAAKSTPVLSVTQFLQQSCTS